MPELGLDFPERRPNRCSGTGCAFFFGNGVMAGARASCGGLNTLWRGCLNEADRSKVSSLLLIYLVILKIPLVIETRAFLWIIYA